MRVENKPIFPFFLSGCRIVEKKRYDKLNDAAYSALKYRVCAANFFINSTGIDLTDIDRIRNFLLMDLETDLQEKLYIDYWVKIEDSIGYDNLIDFFCSYLVSYGSNSIEGTTITKRSLYTVFKIWFSNLNDNTYKDKFDTKTEFVLNDITDSAIFYHDYVMAKMPDPYP